jgi:NitT/TauT family transport system ATP-binding protein
VIVCTRRPAMIALEQRIPLSRPRDVLNVRFTNEFKELYDALWERLRVEYHEERV